MNTKIDKALKEASNSRFWGSIEIQFKNGTPVLIRKTETETLDNRETNSYGTRQQYK